MWAILLAFVLAVPTPPPGQPWGTPTPTPPHPAIVVAFQADWLAPGRARITWESDAPMLCLGKRSATGAWFFLECAHGAVEDSAPVAGDRYILMQSGVVLGEAPLRSRALLPVVLR